MQILRNPHPQGQNMLSNLIKHPSFPHLGPGVVGEGSGFQLIGVIIEEIDFYVNWISENLMNGDSPYPQMGPIGKVLPLPTPVDITGRGTGDGSDDDAGSSPVSSLDKRHAHTHTMWTRRVCWHRNTSISMAEHSLSVRVSSIVLAEIICLLHSS